MTRDRYYIVTRQPETLELLRAPWDLPARLVIELLHRSRIAQVVAHGDFEYLCKDFNNCLFLDEIVRPCEVGFGYERRLLGFFADIWKREEHVRYKAWVDTYWEKFPEAA